jgi:hypothetical protein
MCESLFQIGEADEVLPATLLFKIFYSKTNKLGDKRQNIITCSSACFLAHISSSSILVHFPPFFLQRPSQIPHISRASVKERTPERKRKIKNDDDYENAEQLEQRPKQNSAIAVSFLSTAAAGRPFPS